MSQSRVDIEKVGTSALVGAAGGAALVAGLGIVGVIVGGIVGASITGYSEYKSERTAQVRESDGRKKDSSIKEQLHTH